MTSGSTAAKNINNKLGASIVTPTLTSDDDDEFDSLLKKRRYRSGSK